MSIDAKDHDKPTKGRFAAGRSGNPGGRPRKIAGSLSDAVRAAQKITVVVNEGGARKRMTKAQIGSHQLANKCAAGDLPSLRFPAKIEGDAPEQNEPRTRVHSDTDKQIAARLVARINGFKTEGLKMKPRSDVKKRHLKAPESAEALITPDVFDRGLVGAQTRLREPTGIARGPCRTSVGLNN